MNLDLDWQDYTGQMTPNNSNLKYYILSQKNARLCLEANISGLKAPIGQSWTSFENYMFSAFIWAQEQFHSSITEKIGF